MFAKLKKKIQEEAGDGGGFGSPLGVGPGLASPVRPESGNDCQILTSPWVLFRKGYAEPLLSE